MKHLPEEKTFGVEEIASAGLKPAMARFLLIPLMSALVQRNKNKGTIR